MVKHAGAVIILLIFSSALGSAAQEIPVSTSSEIVGDIRDAFALEEKMWDREQLFSSREEVAEFFRQGFGEEQARRLAEFFWLEPTGTQGDRGEALRATEPVLIMPDEIEVLSVSEDEAAVLLHYEARPEGAVVWDAHSVSAELRREEGIWKIYTAEPAESAAG